MLLDAMGPSLLGNILAGKGAIAKRQGQEIELEKELVMEIKKVKKATTTKWIFSFASSID